MSEVYILTEGGKNTGLGHVTRCAALRDELVRSGHSCYFYVNGDGSVKLAVPDAEIRQWHNEDVRFFKNAHVIADSYNASQELLEQISLISGNVLYIDDYNRLKYPPGIVVNPSIYGEYLPYVKTPGVKYLLGADYVILRQAFRRSFDKAIKREIEKITLIMGGTDVLGLTPYIAELILGNFPDIELNVVYGGKLTDNICKNPNAHVLSGLDAAQIASLFLRSDLVISAAGQTCYELVQTRTPSLLIKTAENQAWNIRAMTEKGLCIETGPHDLIKSVKDMTFEIRSVLKIKMSSCDFSNGVSNIISAFIGGENIP